MNLIMKKEHYSDILTLAVPVIIANVGQVLVQVVDNIMVGRLGDLELASASFAGMIVTNIMMFGMGIAMGLTPKVGYSYVAKEYGDCSRYFQNSLLQNGLFGIGMVLLFVAMVPLLDHFGQPQEVVDNCKTYFLIIGASVFPYMIFMSFKQFMDGVGNTRISMIITIGVNLLNVLLNYLLIYGEWGLPEMGMNGAAVATFIARLLMPILFFIYMRQARFYRNFLKFFAWNNISKKVNKSLLNLGFPIASQLLIEFFALSVTGIMMGWLGTKEIAANQIVFTTISLFFLVTNGISAAATILVSHRYGRGDKAGIRDCAITATQVSVVFMIFAGAMLLIFGSNIASIYVSDPAVIAIAAQIFGVVAFMEVFDGLQVTTLGILRGMGDVSRPMVYAGICYGAISLSVAYIFGFVFNYGAQGIWLGFAVGVTIAFVLFTKRIIHNLKMM